MWKTGTTSIQNSLFNNKLLLSDEGLSYPSELPNHIFLLPLIHKNFVNHVAIKSYKPGLGKLRTILDDFLHELDSAKSDTTYILSSEFFFDLTIDEIESFKSLLIKYFDDIKIVCYIRSPLSHFKSAVNEQVKQGHYTLDEAYKRHVKIKEYDRIYSWEKYLD